MEVEINGIKAELGDSIPAITRRSFDVDSPSKRFIDITNRFKLPDTLVNRRIFESPQGIGTNSRSYEKIYSVLIRDSTIIFRGYGYLSNTSKNSFSFQVVDQSKDLFNYLDSRLNSISWDDEDTALTQAEIDALDTADASNCWFWGKACYHKDAFQKNTDMTTGDARTKYSRPAFYVHALFKRAIENLGYTFTVPDLELAMSSNHVDFFFTGYQKTISSTTYNPAGTLSISGFTTYDFKHADISVTSTVISIGTTTVSFRIRGTLVCDADIYLCVKGTDVVDSSKVSISKILLTEDTTEIDFTSGEFQSDDSMNCEIYFEGTGQVDFTDVLIYTITSEKTQDLSTNPFLNYKIKAYDNLPDLTYNDLFRLICVTGNKYHSLDTLNKTFEFGTLENLNKLNSVDWSDKFIQGSEDVTSKFSRLYQKNLLSYTNDLTVNPTLGQGYFLTDNESLQSEGEYITLLFGASVDIEINSNDVVQVKIYEDTGRIADQDIAPRIFTIDSDKLQFEPLRWNNLKDSCYSNFFNSLSRVRAMTGQFNLNKLDVMKWKPNDLIYIDYFKTTFIVLEINNSMPGKATKVNLLNYGR